MIAYKFVTNNNSNNSNDKALSQSTSKHLIIDASMALRKMLIDGKNCYFTVYMIVFAYYEIQTNQWGMINLLCLH